VIDRVRTGVRAPVRLGVAQVRLEIKQGWAGMVQRMMRKNMCLVSLHLMRRSMGETKWSMRWEGLRVFLLPLLVVFLEWALVLDLVGSLVG